MKQWLLYIFLLLSTCCLTQCKSKIYTAVEQMPSFPGGDNELAKFVYGNLKLPYVPDSLLVENSSTTLRFIITKDGRIDHIEPYKLQYKGTMLTDSLTAILNRMPRWIPGKHNGKNVDVYYMLPLRISLKR